jgi:hypothetical protein
MAWVCYTHTHTHTHTHTDGTSFITNAALHVGLNYLKISTTKPWNSTYNRKTILGHYMLTFHIGWKVDVMFSQQ